MTDALIKGEKLDMEMYLERECCVMIRVGCPNEGNAREGGLEQILL